MGWVFALVAVSLLVFGGGLFCGFFVFRGGPSISVTLPDNVLAEPMKALQRTINHFDSRLVQHIERLERGVQELKVARTTSAQLSDIGTLIAAHQDFQKQLGVFAADVRQAGRDIATAGPDHESREDASPHAAPPAVAEHKLNELVGRKYRSEQRHPFLCRQWIAPYNGDRVPEPDEFFSVQCRDISSGGISFFMDRTPTFDMVVVRLSTFEEPKYLTARIQRTVPSMNTEYGRYIVGCKLLGTLQRNALPADLEDTIRRREVRNVSDELSIA